MFFTFQCIPLHQGDGSGSSSGRFFRRHRTLKKQAHVCVHGEFWCTTWLLSSLTSAKESQGHSYWQTPGSSYFNQLLVMFPCFTMAFETPFAHCGFYLAVCFIALLFLCFLPLKIEKCSKYLEKIHKKHSFHVNSCEFVKCEFRGIESQRSLLNNPTCFSVYLFIWCVSF